MDRVIRLEEVVGLAGAFFFFVFALLALEAIGLGAGNDLKVLKAIVRKSCLLTRNLEKL